MRRFSPAYGPKVDLDDPKTYSYLPNKYRALDNLMMREIGYALVYMDYFPDRRKFFPKRKRKPDMIKVSEAFPGRKFKDPNREIDLNNGGYEQRQRVQKLIQDYATNRRRGHDDLLWLKEQIYLFHNEIENMC